MPYGLNWSPASNRIGEATLSARSWDATTGKNVVNYGAQRGGSVFSVVWSPDGKRVAVVAVGQGVQIYNAATGKLLDTYPVTVKLHCQRRQVRLCLVAVVAPMQLPGPLMES